MGDVITTQGLTKDYGDGRGLFDLDLRVPQGRIHGFLGPNGAGKTTAIRLLLGFLRPTRGAARVLGLDPGTQAAQIKARVGYIPGELALPEMLTGRDHLEQSAALRGGVDEARQEDLIDRLEADLGLKTGKLSKGNRQKIALIDAFQHDPELLIMDEPTDGLDPLLRREVRALLQDHVERGGTVFLSSHVVHEIQTMCDDVSIVIGGKLHAQAAIPDLLADAGVTIEAAVADLDQAAQVLQDHGATDIRHRAGRIRCRLREALLPALAALHRLGAQDLRIHQTDLEETFLRLYQEDAR